MSQTAQTLYDHVRELRLRLTFSALALIAGGGVGYFFHNRIISYLSRPIHESLYYSSPAGGFNFVMKICFVLGLALALPVLIYNIIRFISPAFGSKLSIRHAYMITFLSLILAVGGVFFAYYSVVPMSLHFFQGFQTATIKPLLSASEYLTFVLNCVLAFMLIFQLPLFIIFIDRIKPIPPRKFLKYEKFVIVGSLVVALVLPFSYDPLTQFLIAVPIVLLYNFSAVIIVFIHHSRRHRKPKKINNVQTSDSQKVTNQAFGLVVPTIMSGEASTSSVKLPERKLVVNSDIIRPKHQNHLIKPPTSLHQVMRSQTLTRSRINDFAVAVKPSPNTKTQLQKPPEMSKPLLWDIVKSSEPLNNSLNNTALAE